MLALARPGGSLTPPWERQPRSADRHALQHIGVKHSLVSSSQHSARRADAYLKPDADAAFDITNVKHYNDFSDLPKSNFLECIGPFALTWRMV
ncbi:hypothetical protein BN2476_1640005 [Paraburkholderia piptadeniae]|uniref:Uncharacterized protein n=1 Tax=Paraburkholderia piptadeniae TaxID=1701573 RepID=A0A1N7SX64_9BURK|nr:hypothetical protein BN2476_1640005 [Paraburkholderia piptadeniae]